MHIKVERKELLTKLELAQKISTKHATLPVLQCVLLQAEGDTLVIKATNLEIGLEATIPATVEEVGGVAVPATILAQTIALFQQTNIILRVEDTKLVVEGVDSETSIKVIPHEEFPSIPKVSSSGQILQKELFSLGIKTAAIAASVSSIKAELGSVFVSQKREHTLTFVATDSFRLMEKTVPQKNIILEESIMIPYRNALELARICDQTDEEAQLLIDENQCAVMFTDGTYVTSRLTNGSFPDYEQIIPKEYSTHTTLVRHDLQNVFKKTNIFLNKFLQVTFHVATTSLTVSANNGDVGTTTDSIKAETEGDELTLNFNQRYIAESLTHFSDDSITLHFAGIGRPLVIKGVSDTTVRYLVMPMNK